MLDWAESIRADHTITDVVNIGIGGSDLGPQMAVLALDEFMVAPGKRVSFRLERRRARTRGRAQKPWRPSTRCS